ncbi:MAG: PilZ domain-containing protein [Rhizobiaceae bacterium]|nr:PilZ domain-containing protein [Rhizobiaceae bacterium]
MRVRVRVRDHDYAGYLTNISKGGMRLSTDEVAEIWTGDRVEVLSNDFGLMTGTARWRSPGNLGVRFNDTTNNNARVNAILRFFHLST